MRVVNAAAAADEIDLFAQGSDDALVGGVDFQSISDYDEVDPRNGTLDIRLGGEDRPIASVANINLEAGKSYTVVVVGNQGRGSKLEAFVIEDVVGAPTTANTR